MLQLRAAEQLSPRTRASSRPASYARPLAVRQIAPRDPRLASALLILVDAIALAASVMAVVTLWPAIVGPIPRDFATFAVIGGLSFAALQMAAGSYDRDRLSQISRVSRSDFLVKPTAWTFIALTFAYLVETALTGRGALVSPPVKFYGLTPELCVVLLASLAVAGERFAGRRLLEWWAAAGHLSTNVVIFGLGPIGQRLVESLRDDYADSVEICGIYDDRLDRVPSEIRGLPVDGDIHALIDFVRNSPAIDKVLIALPLSAEQRILDLMNELRSLTVGVALVPDFIGLQLVRQVGGGAQPPILNVIRKPQSQLDWLVKRGFDIAASATILVAIAPLLALVALAIKLDSRGPILFRQPRLGLNNREFDVLKFRSMYAECSDLAAREQTKRDDPRVTRVGTWLRRLSIDELPQLFNVLSGEMSLVGPRPHALGMQVEDRLCEEIVREYAVRHRVRPGITGWAQVRGFRGAVHDPALLEARVSHDIYYIDNWSFLLDLRILAMTVVALLRPRNAF